MKCSVPAPVRQETIYFYTVPNTMEIGNIRVIDRVVDLRVAGAGKKITLRFFDVTDKVS